MPEIGSFGPNNQNAFKLMAHYESIRLPSKSPTKFVPEDFTEMSLSSDSIYPALIRKKLLSLLFHCGTG